jgi:antitoxin CptB
MKNDAVLEEMARLRWQCRRGMLELDVILQPFFEQYYAELSAAEQNDFERLLASSDQELYLWFIGNERPDDEELQRLVIKIKNFFSTPYISRSSEQFA